MSIIPISKKDLTEAFMEDIKKKKILMALMSFSIGGAETHVLELSAELKKMGFDVVLISGGGEYEEVLKEYGIKHYKAPLYTKHPLKMLKSLRVLRKVIKKEKIDIVHAHGRIPAFLCGILHKFCKFIFVTTAHWVFDTSHGLKYLSNWGEKTVAVSEDIKTYLMGNYNTNPMDIFVTINGIDTDKFSGNADYTSAIKEFSLREDSRKIVYISRLDEDRAEVAFRLLNIAPKLYEKFPDIEIVIVGGGNVFDKIKEQTEAVNKKVGKRLVTLTGGRTDVYKLAAMSDVFVGVSRSALEAMSCSKPVIVAGNEGYIGIFDEDKLDVSIDTNFCCRGCEPSSDERLEKDLFTLLSADSDELNRLSKYSRETILNMYSLSKMADDNIRMYKAAADSYKYDAVISGYYGFGNSGDEALLEGIIKNLKTQNEDIKICVLSKNSERTEEMHGVHAVNRYNFLRINKILKKSRLFISGGGSLIQDVTSSKSLWYYTNTIKHAKKLGLPVMVYANGIGPVTKTLNQKRTKDVLDLVDKITLRENGSLDELKSIGLDIKNVSITADPALSLEPLSAEKTESILKSVNIEPDKKYIGICVRKWKESKESFVTDVAEALNEVCNKYGLIPVFIPLNMPDDYDISCKIAEKTGPNSKIIDKTLEPREVMALISKMEIMLCMRLHGLVFAANCAVPAVNISYDPKVLNFADYVGLESNIELKEMTKEELLDKLISIVENKEEIKGKMILKNDFFKEKAAEDAYFATELIEKRK